MKLKYTHIGLSLLILLGLSLSPQAVQGEVFVSKSAGFSADFPTPPQARTVDEKTTVGTIVEHFYSSKGPKGKFTVEFSKLPGIAVFFGGHNTIYNKAREAFLKKTGAKQISFNKITIQGEKAAELSFTTATGVPGKAHFILIKKRFYVVTANSSEGNTPIDQFLNSFKFLPS